MFKQLERRNCIIQEYKVLLSKFVINFEKPHILNLWDLTISIKRGDLKQDFICKKHEFIGDDGGVKCLSISFDGQFEKDSQFY